MPKPNERYIAKNGMEFEHWIEPSEALRQVFGISADQSKAIREEYPAP